MNSEHMKKIGAIGGKRGKRGKDTVESLTKRIQVVAENEGVEVSIKVRRRRPN